MGLFRKKPDPISERAKALNAQIAALEEQIRALNARLAQQDSHPHLRSAATPAAPAFTATYPPSVTTPAQREPAAGEELVFEELDREKLKERPETTTPDHYNAELGLRKYDLVALISRIRNHFRPPAPSNPKLISYLAAGSIQGLRPLRYEKRVARNRFIVLVIFLLLVLLGLISMFVRNK